MAVLGGCWPVYCKSGGKKCKSGKSRLIAAEKHFSAPQIFERCGAQEKDCYY